MVCCSHTAYRTAHEAIDEPPNPAICVHSKARTERQSGQCPRRPDPSQRRTRRGRPSRWPCSWELPVARLERPLVGTRLLALRH